MADETPTTASSSTSSPPSSDAQQDGMLTIHLTVTGNQGSPRIPLRVAKDVTPTQLRRLAAEATSIPLAALRLIFGGRMVQDNDEQSAASVLKLEDGCVLHCIGKPSAATAPSTSGMDAAGTSNAAGAAAVPVTGSLATATTTATATSSSTATAAATSSVAAALQELRRGNSETSYKTAVSTLDKILSNIVEHPMEEKYRNLKVNNPAFQRRFGALSGAEAVMLACGFARQDQPVPEGGGEGAAAEPYYVLQASADNWPRLLETHASVKALAARLSSAAAAAPGLAASNQPSLPWGGVAAPLPGSGPAGVGGLPFAQSQAVQSLMSDPANLQRMLQVRSITL
jgi:PUB domain